VKQIVSKDYHDYFIKDGEFIGRFEDMYQNVEDPWHIDRLGRRLDMDAALLLLTHAGRPFHRILDVGCGKGLFTSFLAERISGRIHAFDVSKTAIESARQRYRNPRIDFFVFDANGMDRLPYRADSFDLIVLAQTLWCILPNLKKVLDRFYLLLEKRGGLLISQHFLPPDRQQYGRDILSTPEDCGVTSRKRDLKSKPAWRRTAGTTTIWRFWPRLVLRS